MGLHKTTLKSAVDKYSGFFKAGEGEDFTRAEIAKDDRRFEQADIDEIFEAIVAKAKLEETGGEGQQGNPGESNNDDQTGSNGENNPPVPSEGEGSQPNPDEKPEENDDEQNEDFDDENLANFVKSLTPEQAEKLHKAIAEAHGFNTKPVEQNTPENLDAKTATPAPAEAYEPGAKYEAVTEFRDADNFMKVHSKGDDVTHFTPSRINFALANGYIKKSE